MVIFKYIVLILIVGGMLWVILKIDKLYKNSGELIYEHLWDFKNCPPLVSKFRIFFFVFIALGLIMSLSLKYL